MVLRAGFVWLRSKGSHRIYAKGGRRVVVPFLATRRSTRRPSKRFSKPSRKPRTSRFLLRDAEVFSWPGGHGAGQVNVWRLVAGNPRLTN